MTVAFITKVELQPEELNDLTAVAQEITDILMDGGFEVSEVHAWAGETRQAAPVQPAQSLAPMQPLSGTVPEIQVG